MNENWKAEAVEKQRQSYEETAKLFRGLSSEQMERPRTHGEWSLRDIFAHIIFWEEEAVKRLRLLSAGRSSEVSYFENMEEVNQANARVVREYRDRELESLFLLYDKINKELIDAIQVLPEAEITNPTHQTVVSVWLPEFAWGHEKEHRDKIQSK